VYSGILAVTRSLGDCAMKDYVTGEPYTQDVKLESGGNHLILACDGVRPPILPRIVVVVVAVLMIVPRELPLLTVVLCVSGRTQLWDVCTDQEAVDLISGESDADSMAKKLLIHALKNGTTDNVSVMVIIL
jgi:protein phosphatase PTC1